VSTIHRSRRVHCAVTSHTKNNTKSFDVLIFLANEGISAFKKLAVVSRKVSIFAKRLDFWMPYLERKKSDLFKQLERNFVKSELNNFIQMNFEMPKVLLRHSIVALLQSYRVNQRNGWGCQVNRRSMKMGKNFHLILSVNLLQSCWNQKRNLERKKQFILLKENHFLSLFFFFFLSQYS
jgi:hypothetical protein